MTTSYYQSGALKYAKEHGIALITITSGSIQYEARGSNWIHNSTIPPWVNVHPYIMVLQKQTSDNSFSCSYISTSDELYKHLTESIGGKEL